MLTVASMRASITFAAGQITEIGRYEVPREESFPGLGIGLTELQMVKVHMNTTKHITIATCIYLLHTAHPCTTEQLTRTYNTAYSTSRTYHSLALVQ